MTACATAGSVEAAPLNAGSSYQLPEPCARVDAAVIPALIGLGFALSSAESLEPCGSAVVVIKPATLASWGEIVRVVVAPAPDGGSRVRIHTRRVLATNVVARSDWSGPVYRALVAYLEDHADAAN